MIKNLKIAGMVIVGILALWGIYRLFSTKAIVLAGTGACPTGTCSTFTGGMFLQMINPGDTFSAGQTTPNFTVGGTQGDAYAGGGMTFGGGTFSTSTSGANNLMASMFVSTSSNGNIANVSYNMISITQYALATTTLTFPASSTLPVSYFLSNTGDMDEIYLYNATTTASVTSGLVFLASTGISFQSATSTATTTGFVLPYNQVKKVELVRLPSSDIRAIVF